MKGILLLLMVMPLAIFAQKDYSKKAIKVFNEGNAAYRSGDFSNAMLLYKKCVQIESQYAEAYVNMSAISFDNKDYVPALSYAKQAHSIEKIQKSVFTQLGKSYYMNNKFDSAVYYLNRIKIFKPLSEEENYFLAASRIQTKDFVGAKKLADDLLKVKPGNSDYTVLRGNASFGLGEYDKALKDYNTALEAEPNNLYIYSNIANTYLKLDKADEAFKFIDKGIEGAKGRDKIAFLILKGNYYHSLKELDNAEKTFNDAYTIDPSNPNVLVNQAGVLLDREKYQSALEKCNLALSKDSQLMEAYYNRGIANEMLRNVKAACQDWEEAFILGSSKAEEFLNSATCNE